MQLKSTGPAATLKDESTTANSLVEVLKREQAHLIQADIDALAAVIEAKTQLVTQMAALTTTRYQALVAAGFAGEEAGMNEWLASANEMAVARESWSELLAIVRAAKELNRTNGLLINKHMSRNTDALNVLRGTPQSNSLYGPNGQATGRAGTRGLVVG